MKPNNPTAHIDLQSFGGDSKLDDIGVFTLVCDRVVTLAHHNTPPWASSLLSSLAAGHRFIHSHGLKLVSPAEERIIDFHGGRSHSFVVSKKRASLARADSVAE
jgi:hypothetical protein